MVASASSKPPLSRRNLAFQTLFVVTLLITGRLLWVRFQPEPLTPIEMENYKISGDHLYGLFSPNPSRRVEMAPRGIAYDSSGYSIQAQSIHDPSLRILVPNDTNSPFRAPYTLGIDAGKLYYAVKPHGISEPPSAPGPFSDTFFLPPQGDLGARITGQMRAQRTQYPLDAEDVGFREVSMQGGKPREAATLRGDSFCLIGSHVFWIRPEGEEVVKVTQKKTSWWEASAHSDLMLTSLSDGSTRCIRHGLYRYTPLAIQETGITWTELAPYPQSPRLFYAHASDGVVRSLSMINAPNPQSLREFGDRLYWTVNTSPPEGFAMGRQVLMSSKLDGADVREVFSELQKHPVSFIRLYPYRDSLYCCLRAMPLMSNRRSQSFLCRLHPDQSDPVEIVRKLPLGTRFAQFEGGYLYGVLRERRRSFWANLMEDDTDQSFIATLCRIPLEP